MWYDCFRPKPIVRRKCPFILIRRRNRSRNSVDLYLSQIWRNIGGIVYEFVIIKSADCIWCCHKTLFSEIPLWEIEIPLCALWYIHSLLWIVVYACRTCILNTHGTISCTGRLSFVCHQSSCVNRQTTVFSRRSSVMSVIVISPMLSCCWKCHTLRDMCLVWAREL